MNFCLVGIFCVVYVEVVKLIDDKINVVMIYVFGKLFVKFGEI